MQTHDVPGKGNDYYWGIQRLPGPTERGRTEVAQTYELEPPYRYGVGVAFRITRRTSVVVGEWIRSPDNRDDDAVTRHLERAVSSSAHGLRDDVFDDELPGIEEWH